MTLPTGMSRCLRDFRVPQGHLRAPPGHSDTLPGIQHWCGFPGIQGIQGIYIYKNYVNGITGRDSAVQQPRRES